MTTPLPISEVDDLVEEEGPAGGAGEPRGDELVPVGQEGVALRAREQPLPADVLQVYPTHDRSVGWGRLRGFRTFRKVRPFCVVYTSFLLVMHQLILATG